MLRNTLTYVTHLLNIFRLLPLGQLQPPRGTQIPKGGVIRFTTPVEIIH